MSEISPLPNITQPKLALQHQEPWRKWTGLGVLSLGLAIVIIDSTLLNVSLSTIIKDLHTNLQSLQWVITAYALVLAAFTITGGRFGDLFGRRKMFILGAVIFAVGSFIASISRHMPELLLGESIIEGFGAALMLPATASLVVANFSGKERATAFGIWGGVAGASSAIGPLLGGYLTSHFSWRWGFRINVFIGLLVVIGSLWLLHESRDESKPGIDWGGMALSALGLLGITFGIVESSTLGWWQAQQAFNVFHHNLNFGGISVVPYSILLGFIMLGLFFWWEKRVEGSGKSPLVSTKLIGNRQFTSGSLTAAILTLGMSGMVFALPVFLQTVSNLDAFHTGLALLPLSLALLLMAPLTGLLSKKIAPKYLIQIGLIVNVIASFILRNTIRVGMSLPHLIPGLTFYGLGMGLVLAPVSNLVLSAVPVEMAGEASGVNNTLRQVGSTLGAAIIGAAVLTSLSGHLVKGVESSSVITASAKPQIIQFVSNPNSNIQFGGTAALPAGTSQTVQQEISQLVAESSAQATQDAYVYSALIAFIAFIVSLFLPITDVHQHEPVSDGLVQRHGGGKFVLAGSLAVLSVAGAVILLHQSSKKVPHTALSDVQEIRRAFGAVSNQVASSTPHAAIGLPGQIGQSVISSSVPPFSGRSENAPSTTSSMSLSPVVSPVITYSNQILGFQMRISKAWQAVQVDANTVVFANAQGQNISVQSYVSGNETLSTVLAQLQGSPSVYHLRQTNFQGQSALTFYNVSARTLALVMVHGSRVYYIMAPSLTQPPVTSFVFLG